MSGNKYEIYLPHMFYADNVTYLASEWRPGTTFLRAWEFNGWKKESMSWKTGCYIHAGLSGANTVVYKGPDAGRLLESLCINGFAKFPVGSLKHLVMLQEDGLIMSHAATARVAEDEYHMFAGGAWPRMKLQEPAFAHLNVQTEIRKNYLFQVAGPTSLALLEKLTGENLRDLKFMHYLDSEIEGMPVRIARLSMSGNLGYELHGPLEEGPKIYDIVYRAGANEEFKLERLGWKTYRVNHVEGGFPQSSVTFANPGFEGIPHYVVSGSVDPSDVRSRMRTAYEARWHKMARFDHDFVGRAALEAEIADPRRTTVMLRWNPEDIVDTYASMFRPGEEYKMIDFPVAPDNPARAHADHVLKDGKRVGWSSGTTYSYYFREVISMACVDLDVTELGTEVIVQWGDFGHRIKEIRATVERFPYLTDLRNNETEVKTLA